MKIARYIGDLLYDYECVVIPGLGGFLANDKPASIQPNTHHFRPPYKQVMFNAYLKTNDGLLVNYIAKEENISYQEAKAQVDKFVYLCDSALKAGKRIHFHKVGTLYLNKNEKIVFEQDNTVNYNADAFGLTGFVSPAIRRSTAEEKIRDAITGNTPEKKTAPKKEPAKKQDRKRMPAETSPEKRHTRLVATRKKSPYRTQLAFLVLLIIAMMIGWGFMNKDMVNAYYNNYSSMIPLFYTQPNAYVINNIDKVPIAKVSSSRFGSWWIQLFEKSKAPVPETASKATPEVSPKASTGAKKPKTKPEAPVSKKPAPVVKKAENTATISVKPAGVKTSVMPEKVYKPAPRKAATTKPAPAARANVSARHYYIIAGAFKSLHNVRSLIYALKKQGYNAMAAGVTANGLHRVAFGVYGNRRQAERQLQKIRRKDNPAAWILVN